MTKFAVFTDEGFPAGFYAEDVHGSLVRPVYGPLPVHTEENQNPEAPVIGEERNPDCLIPPEAIRITDQQWRAFIDNSGLRKWQDGHVVQYNPPEPEPVIPDRISRRQFRLQLIDAGLLEQVESWIATQDIRTQAAYADSTTFLRTDEMLQQGFRGLGFSQGQVDQFFIAAGVL